MTDTPPEGWFPDPMGRAPERFWDGGQWTTRVRDGLVSWDDPLDAPAGAAVGAAAGATAAYETIGGASAAPDPGDNPLRGGPAAVGLRAHLHRPRPPLDIGAAIAAAAGVLGTVGAYVLIADTDGTAPTVVMSIVLVVAAYALALVGPPGGRPAAIVAGIVAPIVAVFAGLGGELDGKSAVVVPGLLLAGIWAGMFVLPGLRAAPTLIAAVAIALWAVVVTLTARAPRYDGWYSYSPDGGYLGSSDSYLNDPWGSFTQLLANAGAITLVLGLVLVVAAAVLDRNGWHVAATPLVGVTVFFAVLGLWLSSTATAGSEVALLVMAVGVVLTIVGTLGARRGSAWIGVALATGGLVAFIADLVDEPTGVGVLLLVVAGGFMAAAHPIATKLDRLDAGS